ncbi:hypothetical protein Scep_016646 [Stephania cephalantha]|uniref:Uncharacterized protein n=1 Tax=Stephania cephalantha TaxID=152367 RepID=A0AAP0NTG6_9MAGN
MNSSQSIVSPNGAFELGFFSLDQAQVQSSTHPKRFYLGIWYKNIPPIRNTIVWVANRDKPIIVANNNSSCYLTLNSDGNLMIFSSGHDQKEAVSIYLTSISPAKNVTATLLDTGNFVLRDNNSINSTNIVSSATTDNFLWQSFDYPTDTFLPGMKLGFNYKIGWTWNLSSWRSPQDPSPGQYTLIVNTNTTEFQVLNGSQILWTSGPWNSDGKYFSFIPEMRVKGVYSFDYVSNPNEQYFHVIVNTNWFFLSRFLMNSSGRIQQYFTWMGDRRDAQNWILFWEEPRKECHVYRYCGAYSNCDQTQFPYCQCLKGFQPSTYKEWSEKQWTSGCARRSSLQCGGGDGFLLMRNTSLPLEPKSVELQSVEECKASCLGICSCTAFAYDSSVCLVWFGILYNVRLADFNGSDLFVKLSASELKNFEGNPADKAQDLMLFDFNATAKRSLEGEGSSSSKLMMSGGSWDVELPFFSFASVCSATNNFSDQNRLGQGGFGPVYKVYVRFYFNLN